jgi:hypothetical protein
MAMRLTVLAVVALFAAACGTEDSTRYQAGVARELVDPDHPVDIAGYGLCAGDDAFCRHSAGIHDHISASAVALRDNVNGEAVIFVAVDASGMLRYDMDLIHAAATVAFRQQLGIDFDGTRVVVGASHSHQAPDMSGMYGPMLGAGRDEAYATYVRDQVVKAAIGAYRDLKDVDLDWGKGSLANTTKDPYAIDPDLFVLRGRTPAGETVFTMTRWSSHPTVYPEQNHGISADYVGVFRSQMEKRLGGMAVYFNGSIGSVYPITPAPCTLPDEFPEGWKNPVDSGDPKFDVALQFYQDASCIGGSVVDAAVAALDAPLPVAETGLTARFTEFQFHPENETMQYMAEQAPMHWDASDATDPTSMMGSQFSWITVGDLDYLTVPGEAFPSLGYMFQETLGRPNTIILGLTQDWLGYLLTARLWAEMPVSVQYHISLSVSSKIQDAYIAALNVLKAKE